MENVFCNDKNNRTQKKKYSQNLVKKHIYELCYVAFESCFKL